MIIATKESREYPLFNSVNRSVRETRQFEKIYPTTKENVQVLVNHLVRQAPNRLYFAPDGRFCWVLMFNETTKPFQLRIETLQILNEQPEVIKGEFISAVSLDALEHEIIWWRRQFGMNGDLVNKPITILQSQSYDHDFVHLAGPRLEPFYYRYSIGRIGPRLLAIGKGTDYQIEDGEVFTRIPRPPTEILAYSHPFQGNR